MALGRSQPCGNLLLSCPAWVGPGLQGWLGQAGFLSARAVLLLRRSCPCLERMAAKMYLGTWHFVCAWWACGKGLLSLWAGSKQWVLFYSVPRVLVAMRQWVRGFIPSLCVLSKAWLKIAADTRSCLGWFNHSCLCEDAAASARLKVFLGSSHMSSWVAMTLVNVGHEYIIELRGAKKIKMLRMMVNFRKGNLQESEQVS